MAATTTGARPGAVLSRLRAAVGAAALAGIGLALGYGLAMVGSLFGDLAPVAIVGLVLLPAALVAMLADPRVAAIAGFALIPVGTTKVGPVPADLVILAVAVFIAVIALRRLAEGTSPVAWSPPLWWMLALLAWTILGFPGAVDSALAVRQIVQLGGGVLFASVIVAACRKQSDVRVVVAGVVATAFVVALLALGGGQELEAQYGGSYVSGRAQGPFTQPNELGSFCAPMALISLAMAVTAPTRRMRTMAGVVTFALLAALALSLSRGAWIGFGAGAVVLLVMLAQARRALLAMAPVLLVAAMTMGAFAPTNPQVEVIGARLKSISGEKNPYDNRPAIWAEARREVQARPLLGYGAGSFPVASVASTSESRTTFAVHAHNLMLTWAAETGLPGAALLIGLGAHLAMAASRAKRRVVRAAGTGMGTRAVDAGVIAGTAAAMVAVFGQGMVDYTLRNSAIFVAVFGILGVLLAAIRTSAGTADQ